MEKIFTSLSKLMKFESNDGASGLVGFPSKPPDESWGSVEPLKSPVV